MHFQRIVHRDIKPSNLLIDANGHVKIADLGVCNEFDGSDDLLSSSAGTPAFAAPEALDPSTTSYSGKALDIWALGCTLYAFVYGRLPYNADSVLAVHDQIRAQPVQWPVDPETSPQLVHLLHRLLDKDPNARITLPAIKQHDWVTRSGAEPLPTEQDNCQLVEVSEEEMMNVIKSVPKLNTLILIKAMLKNHSFLVSVYNIHKLNIQVRYLLRQVMNIRIELCFFFLYMTRRDKAYKYSYSYSY